MTACRATLRASATAWRSSNLALCSGVCGCTPAASAATAQQALVRTA